MNLREANKIRYDPIQIISQRRQKNKNTPYEYEKVQGLEAIANQENLGEGK